MHSSNPATDSLAEAVMTTTESVIKFMPELPSNAMALLRSCTDTGHLADVIASHMELESHEKQNILETFAVPARLEKVREFLDRWLVIARLRESINTRVSADMSKDQAAYRQRIRRERVKALEHASSDHRRMSASIEDA